MADLQPYKYEYKVIEILPDKSGKELVGAALARMNTTLNELGGQGFKVIFIDKWEVLVTNGGDGWTENAYRVFLQKEVACTTKN